MDSGLEEHQARNVQKKLREDPLILVAGLVSSYLCHRSERPWDSLFTGVWPGHAGEHQLPWNHPGFTDLLELQFFSVGGMLGGRRALIPSIRSLDHCSAVLPSAPSS